MDDYDPLQHGARHDESGAVFWFVVGHAAIAWAVWAWLS